jgi:hypothetical protein
VSTAGAQGGESAGEEEMEDHEEMEEDSNSTCQYSRLSVLSLRTADARLLNLGIPPSATAISVRLEKTVVPIGHDWQGCVDHRLEKTVVSSGTTTDLRKQ